jgi:hypothetical protein
MGLCRNLPCAIVVAAGRGNVVISNLICCAAIFGVGAAAGSIIGGAVSRKALKWIDRRTISRGGWNFCCARSHGIGSAGFTRLRVTIVAGMSAFQRCRCFGIHRWLRPIGWRRILCGPVVLCPHDAAGSSTCHNCQCRQAQLPAFHKQLPCCETTRQKSTKGLARGSPPEIPISTAVRYQKYECRPRPIRQLSACVKMAKRPPCEATA